MPQVWMTYQELGDELGCDAAGARAASIAAGWTRKHSHDGLSRVLLPRAMMQAFFENEVARQHAVMMEALASARHALATGGAGADRRAAAA